MENAYKQESTTLTLGTNWLDASPTYAANESTATALQTVDYGFYNGSYWYPYYERVVHHYHSAVDPRPIKLTMSEVERLRVMAKKDKDLKKILSKFTDLIEVTVDF